MYVLVVQDEASDGPEPEHFLYVCVSVGKVVYGSWVWMSCSG